MSDGRIVAERLAYPLADGRALLKDLTLSFGRERTGVIGPNGSGKQPRASWTVRVQRCGKAERDAREVQERQAHRDAKGRRSRATANMPKVLLNARKAQAQATNARVRAITEREVEERRERARWSESHGHCH